MRILDCAGVAIVLSLAFVSTAFADNSTYWTIERDYRKCMYPMCGGYWVERVNRAYTRCADGTWQEKCYVVDLDWTVVDLSDQQISDLESAVGTLLLRGEFDEVYFDNLDFGPFHNLAVTEAWVAATEQAPQGQFVRLYDNGIRCVTTPCPSIDQAILNHSWSFAIHSFDLAPSGATEEQIDEGVEAIFSEGGLLAAGTNYWFFDNYDIATGFYASQFYLRVNPATECIKTGCSGQICADEHVITTCEWFPEYACITMQTCEVQDEGHCGWTPTKESEACFDSLEDR
jgi:hypothetical protein